MERRRPARIAVVGSCNVDLVFGAPRRPQGGETLIGTSFAIFPGGKGANQAIAAARAGGQVTLVGRVGTDPFGQTVRDALEGDGVSLEHLAVDAQHGTGVAGIVVEPDGTNCIVVVPQANRRLSPADVERAAPVLAAADILLLQLETPVTTSLVAARIAKGAGALVLLNPAPAADVPEELMSLVDVLTPNETEAQQLSGVPAATDEGAARAAQALVDRGVGAVLLTLGERGALLVDSSLADSSGEQRIHPFPVHAVDTTAAGDAFCAALAVALGEGRTLIEAARFASAAGALAVTVAGAAPSLPRRPAIEALLGRPRS